MFSYTPSRTDDILNERLRSEFLYCFGELCRSRKLYQRTILDKLELTKLLSFLTSRRPLILKLSALRCINCLIEDNEELQGRLFDELFTTSNSNFNITRLINDISNAKNAKNSDYSLSIHCFLSLAVKLLRNYVNPQITIDLIRDLIEMCTVSYTDNQTRLAACCSLVCLLHDNEKLINALNNDGCLIRIAEKIIDFLLEETENRMISSILAFLLCILVFYDPIKNTFLSSNADLITVLRTKSQTASNQVIGQAIVKLLQSASRSSDYLEALQCTDHNRLSVAHQPIIARCELQLDEHFLQIHSSMESVFVRRINREFCEMADGTVVDNPFERECLYRMESLRSECHQMYEQAMQYYESSKHYFSQLCDSQKREDELTKHLHKLGFIDND